MPTLKVRENYRCTSIGYEPCGMDDTTFVHVEDEEDDNTEPLRQKRRRIARKIHHPKNSPPDLAPATPLNAVERPEFDFLTFVSFINEFQVGTVMPRDIKPRNFLGVIGDGGSFLVYEKTLPFDHLDQSSEKPWSEGTQIVLKRSQVPAGTKHYRLNHDQLRIKSSISEILVLSHPPVRDHENIVDFLGITWDIESDSHQTIWPVLILERAEFGSLDLFISLSRPFAIKLQLCADIANGLFSLHSCGIAHCDIKSENILIFRGSDQHREFVAKISDFGCEVVGVNSDTLLPDGIAFTKPWNAPEYNTPLHQFQVLKTDIYSFGMLFWRVVMDNQTFADITLPKESPEQLEYLESLKRSDQILTLALDGLKNRLQPTDASICTQFLTSTLQSNPDLRSDLSLLITVLTGETPPDDASSEDSTQIQAFQPTPFSAYFEGIYERSTAEVGVGTELVKALEKWSTLTGKDIKDAAEASYHLCLCCCNKFGMEFNPDKALSWMLQSAKSGSIKAQAEIKRLFDAFGREIPNDLKNDITTWLAAATIAGSQTAATELETWNPEVFFSARTTFRLRFTSIDNKMFDLWNVSQLREIIKINVTHVDELIVNERGNRLLHCAASCGRFDAVQMLIVDAGGDVNILNNENETPLLCAFRSGYPQIINLLVLHGADFGIASHTGETALHWLIGLCREDLPDVSLILKHHHSSLLLEAEYGFYEETGYPLDLHPRGTPLDWAVDVNRVDIVRLLLSLGANPFSDLDFSAVLRAVSYHRYEIVEEFLHHDAVRDGINDFHPKWSLLCEALSCQNRYPQLIEHEQSYVAATWKTVQLLIANGARLSDVDDLGQTALHIAVTYCETEIVELLLDNGCQEFLTESCNGVSPLHQAMLAGNINVFHLLVQRGADTYALHKDRLSILHLCAALEAPNSFVFASKLVPRKDIDALSHSTDGDGLTPFHEAVLSRNFAVADLFLEHGANPRALTKNGEHIMAKVILSRDSHSIEGLRYLIERDLAEFIVDKEAHVTALHLCASLTHFFGDTGSNRQKFSCLLKKYSTADRVNYRTFGVQKEHGAQTPLHWAASSGNYFATVSLLEAGALVDVKDDEMKTPLDLARELKAELEEPEGVQFQTAAVFTKSIDDVIELLQRWKHGTRPITDFESLKEQLDRFRFSEFGFITDGLSSR